MKLERLIAVVAVLVLVSNGIVLVKEMSRDEEVVEIKQQIYKIRDTQEKVDKRVERLEKIVLVKTRQQVAMSAKELDCLAKNIYHEAGVEDRAGKIAVAQVTVNRLQEGKWGNNICKVVYSKAQFSWTLDKKKRTAQPKGELWTASVAVAKEFQAGIRVKGLENSTHYHADYIRDPQWAKAKQVAKQVGQHIFYKG
jgi:spore germination cell wall hydrolase CwlJ-like protein